MRHIGFKAIKRCCIALFFSTLLIGLVANAWAVRLPNSLTHYTFIPNPGARPVTEDDGDDDETPVVEGDLVLLPDNTHPQALTLAEVNQSYNYDLKPNLSFSSGPINFSAVTWAITAGGLPDELSLNASSGVISGTPTAADLLGSDFEVTATYGEKTATQLYTIIVNNGYLRAKQIAAGMDFHCVVTLDNAAMCWGSNANGQLGMDEPDSRSAVPRVVHRLGPGTVQQVAAGHNHACALTTAGGIKCWGSGVAGELGPGTISTINRAPIDIPAFPPGSAKQVAAGQNFTCAVTADNAAQCWGANHLGTLGNNSSLPSSEPVDVTDLGPGMVKELSLGRNHACALTTSNAIMCWGSGNNGQLGNEVTISSQRTPIPVLKFTDGLASAVTGGHTYTCAITAGGATQCWGSNKSGVLGLGHDSDTLIPTTVTGLESNTSKILASRFQTDSHTCVITLSNDMKCWGEGAYGKLGNNDMSTIYTPVDASVLEGDEVVDGALSYYSTCVIIASGRVKCWGMRAFGMLGDGKTSGSTMMPVDVMLSPP